jgi:hypothetical protein
MPASKISAKRSRRHRRSRNLLDRTVDGGCQEHVATRWEVPDLTRPAGFRAPEGQMTCVAAIGAATWDRT